MRCARRFPTRLVRSKSLGVCLALTCSIITIAPFQVSSVRRSMYSTSGQGTPNGKGRKVKPLPPSPGPPAGNLPRLDEARQRTPEASRTRTYMPSAMRSRRKPQESRRGRKVGDQLPSVQAGKNGPGSISTRVSTARLRALTADRALQLHHPHASRSLPISALYLSSYFLWPLQAANIAGNPYFALRDFDLPYFDFSAAPVPQAATSKIAFTTNRDGNTQIYLMNANGSEQTRLTNDGSNDEHPRWSPNGAEILFQSDRDSPTTGYMDIYVMNANGSAQTRLTASVADDSAASWSPDGSKMVFQSLRNGLDYQIYVMNADGTNQSNLSNSSANDSQPSWSPNGNKIVFASDRDHSVTASVYVMNSSGSNQTRLTFGADTVDDTQPIWSRDGSKIAFVSTRDGNKEIYVMNAD